MGDDLLDLILHEGALDDLPLPSEGRSSPDSMLELFSMPVKSSPTHSSSYVTNPSPPQVSPTPPQATPTGTGAPYTEPEASLTDCCPTNSLEWLLSQPPLDEVDQYYNDQFWLNYSPSNSSAVSSVPSPQQPDSPTFHNPPQSTAISSELLEQYGFLHDHTYAAAEPSCNSPVEEDKYVEKRRKNNIASQVSRAKRKRKYSAMFTRLDELQEENKRLKEEVSIAEVEAAKLKKLIIGKLSAST